MRSVAAIPIEFGGISGGSFPSSGSESNAFKAELQHTYELIEMRFLQAERLQKLNAATVRQVRLCASTRSRQSRIACRANGQSIPSLFDADRGQYSIGLRMHIRELGSVWAIVTGTAAAWVAWTQIGLKVGGVAGRVARGAISSTLTTGFSRS